MSIKRLTRTQTNTQYTYTKTAMNFDCVGIDLRVKEDPADYMGKYVDCCGFIRDHPDGPVVGTFPSDDFKVGWQTSLRRSERTRKPIQKPEMLNTLSAIPDDTFYKRQQRLALKKQRRRRSRMKMSMMKKRRTKYTYVGFHK